MEQLTTAALGMHVVRTPNDEPEWDLIRPRTFPGATSRHTGRRRRARQRPR